MPVKGKVYVVPLPEENAWQLVVHNTGDRVFGVTQNILPANNPNLTAHDDHIQYGHGMGVDPGKVSWQKFIAGDIYDHHDGQNRHAIDESCFLRVGLRNLANHTVRLPAMHDPPLEIDLEEFNWYQGNAHDATPEGDGGIEGTRPAQRNVADGASVLTRVHELIAQATAGGLRCEGSASVSAVRSKDGLLSHWEVRFDNAAEQAWIGTAAFVGAQKNDGIGLESMGVPNKGSAAMQRIEAWGNYGVEAAPGAKIRLGVRGYAWIEVPLPSEGKLEIPLVKFKIDAKQRVDEFFDKVAVTEKRSEKFAKVQFFEKNKSLNDKLVPTTWTGDEGKRRATFDAPRLRVKTVPSCKEHPGGGYLVALESRLPEFVDDERAGFLAAIRMNGAKVNSAKAKALSPQKLEYPGKIVEWFIAKGQDCGGVKAEAGAQLLVATKGLGWSATVNLPGRGEVDSDATDVWGLREDQESKRLLRQQYTERLRT